MSNIDALEKNAQKLIGLAGSVVAENVALARENKKLTDQLTDALDEVYALGMKVRERDAIIEELQHRSIKKVSR